ncbi:hypothetical protein [Nonomuraea longicatena]|uniref:hypothetical protein n=1 Tax=Nonomuraea longicatena TaxID=83682 RepID=UPI0031CFAE89
MAFPSLTYGQGVQRVTTRTVRGMTMTDALMKPAISGPPMPYICTLTDGISCRETGHRLTPSASSGLQEADHETNPQRDGPSRLNASVESAGMSDSATIRGNPHDEGFRRDPREYQYRRHIQPQATRDPTSL